MNKNPERGEVRPGCLFILLLTVVLIFLVIRIGPVLVAKINFEDDLNSITSKAGVFAWSEKVIVREINTATAAYGFKTSRDDITITRTNRYQQAPRIIVSVKFSKAVEFPGYTYVFKFESTSAGLIGRL